MKIAIILLLCCGIVQKTTAQAYFANPFQGTFFQPELGVNVGTFFNTEDFLLDMGIGMDELGYDFSTTASFSMRPYRKTVRFKAGNHLYYQAEEKIYQISIDLEKRLYFLHYGVGKKSGKIGLYFKGKFGYFWGEYDGFDKSRNQTFAIDPGAGLSWQFNHVARISLGYLYYPQNPYVQPHTIEIKFNFFTGRKKTGKDS